MVGVSIFVALVSCLGHLACAVLAASMINLINSF